MSTSTTPAPAAPEKCTKCAKPAPSLPTPVRKCAKCLTTPYCSRACQRADGKAHKRICTPPGARGADGLTAHERALVIAEASARGTRDSGDKFTRTHHYGMQLIDPGNRPGGKYWLGFYVVPKNYEMFIDAYRLRVKDEYVFGSYMEGYDPPRHFAAFVESARRKECVPDGWDCEGCVMMAMDESRGIGLCILFPMGKEDLVQKWGYPSIVSDLRDLAEKVVGYPVLKPVETLDRLAGMGLRYVQAGGKWKLNMKGL